MWLRSKNRLVKVCEKYSIQKKYIYEWVYGVATVRQINMCTQLIPLFIYAFCC